MEFVVRIRTDNDAFQHDGLGTVLDSLATGAELANILDKLAYDLRNFGADSYVKALNLMDHQGNTVGTAKHYDRDD